MRKKKPYMGLMPEDITLGNPKRFETTMAHISDEGLVDALALQRPELKTVREAAQRNIKSALKAFRDHLARRKQPVDTGDVASYRRELRAYHRAFPEKSDSLVRLFNGMHEWTVGDADRTARGEHLYAASKTNWVKFENGKVDWVTNYGDHHGFHYFDSLEPLRLAWLWTGNEKYSAAFAGAFNDWWEQRDDVEPQWVVWYKLGLAIRSGRCLARALHCMAGTKSFDVQTQTRLLKTILGSCRWLMRDWELFPTRRFNWSLFVASGLITMGVLFPEFREASSWASKGEEIMRGYAAVFKEDGGTESIGYHNGILLSLTRPQRLLLANGLRGYLGDRELQKGLRQGMRLLANMVLPTGQFPAIGDSRYGDPVEALSLGAELLKDPELKSALLAIGDEKIRRNAAFHIPGHPTFTSLNVLKRRFLPGITAKPWRARSCLFPRQGLTVLRSGGSFSGTTCMTISHDACFHSHLDSLGIMLFAFGELFLSEAGVPNYYGPHTAEMRRSTAHNCLVVDGADMLRLKPKLLFFETGRHADFWRCRSIGYHPLGVINTRTVAHIKEGNGFFVVIDQVRRRTSEKRQLDVYWHTLQNHVRVESARRVFFGSGPVLTIASPENNGFLRQGKDWSTLLETNLVSKQFPFVAWRKTSTQDEFFCSVLAPDPASPRDITVQVRKGKYHSLEIEVLEGASSFLLRVPGKTGRIADTSPGSEWGSITRNGANNPIQIFARTGG